MGMKVLVADSRYILGTRKLWPMFPIRQKIYTTAAFLDNPNFSMATMIEAAPKTFMHIQTPNLNRV